ncbi:metal ABC transporter solute-binding protein, Zn/Mn family [Rubellimicrobium aerolatum]|uniref:High-affinity zinc uptake system protein ZnuA n=1 Tax=Rubellimicrobium aerolatum TaxID=490979 RepID=A0ABW0SES3_9RHOB|nr:zinc ABC transporter substrate-binding protein [Rubellimicrobium aerolatum]MBP1805671.1 zinc transport system substrate-binding protein [Rubellimicrobium aerolatum]
MIRAAAVLLLAATPALAGPPAVLADIAPVQGLAQLVMGDLGTPGLIVPPGTSPHDASLSPSEARALTQADVIVRTGDALLPWLGEGIASLAPQARVLDLLATPGWTPLPASGPEHDDHDHGAIDPHAWLDPAVAAAWLPAIAATLSEADPENAATYAANATREADRLRALARTLRDRLQPLRGSGLATGHDSLRYFARAAALPPPRALSGLDGAAPSPSAVAALRESVQSGEIRCLLLDPETDPAWADTLAEGATLRTATVDPEGVTLPPGPQLYPLLIESLAAAVEGCLK